MGTVALGFLTHQRELWSVKEHNAAVLREREMAWRSELEQCATPCRLIYGDLSANLLPDWVMPPDFWEPYLNWLHMKYAPEKQVTFARAEPERGQNP